MKYFIRAIKYFLHLFIILALVIAILVVTKVVSSDISLIFRDGWDSLWQIALVMAAFAAIYPKLGYSARKVTLPGEPAETLGTVREVMDRMGYVIEKQEPGSVCFRRRSLMDRIMKQFEDRITVTEVSLGYEIEGINKDVVRIINALRDAR